MRGVQKHSATETLNKAIDQIKEESGKLSLTDINHLMYATASSVTELLGMKTKEKKRPETIQSKQTYGEHVDKVNYVEMKHVSELAIIGLLLKPFKTWVVPGKPTVILTRTRGGMLEIELVRFMDLLPCQGIYM